MAQSQLPVVKALGLLWLPEEDILIFNTKTPTRDSEWTLRNLTSACARIFYPQGLVSPITVRGRILVQAGWSEQVSWDENLPPLAQTKADKWSKTANRMADDVRIPHPIKFAKKVTESEMLVFCDASKSAQAAAAYMRTTYEDGSVSCNLIASKSKVSPVRKQESTNQSQPPHSSSLGQWGCHQRAVISLTFTS